MGDGLGQIKMVTGTLSRNAGVGFSLLVSLFQRRLDPIAPCALCLIECAICAFNQGARGIVVAKLRHANGNGNIAQVLAG